MVKQGDALLLVAAVAAAVAAAAAVAVLLLLLLLQVVVVVLAVCRPPCRPLPVVAVIHKTLYQAVVGLTQAEAEAEAALG